MPAYTIGTYEDLQAAIIEESGGSSDSNFAEGVRRAIYRTETRLNTLLRVQEMMVRSREEVDERWEIMPSDFLKLRAAWFIDGFDADAAEPTESGTDIPLRLVTPELIGHYSQFRGNPKTICVVGAQYRIEPRVEGDTYHVRLWYYAKVPSLSEDNPNTAILDRYPDLYLNGALSHLGAWLHGDPRLEVWNAQFLTGISEANQATTSRSYPE